MSELLDISVSTVNNWEKNGVPAHREAFVRDRLAAWLANGDAGPAAQVDLSVVPDADLLFEVWRRGARWADRIVSEDNDEVTAPGRIGASGGLQGKTDVPDTTVAADSADPSRPRWGRGIGPRVN